MTYKVCILTSVHPVFDARVFYKEARSLVEAGYNVILIAQYHKKEVVDGIRIIPLPKPKNRFERVIKLQWLLFKLALKEKANIYHFHDPEIMPVCIFLKLFGKKIIYDMHELVFTSIKDKRWIRTKFLKILYQALYQFFEILSLVLFEHIILAEESYIKYFQKKYKRFSKFTVIRNYPIGDLVNRVSQVKHKRKRDIVIYVGALSEERGIKEIILSMKYVEDQAELWLIGIWASDTFKRKCEAIGDWSNIRYLGFIPLNKVYQYIKSSSIGLSILYPLNNYINSIPTKVFDYMLCSLPVIMSNFSYWKTLFKSCALFADPYNPEEIADKVLFLLDNKDMREKLGNTAKLLVQRKYSWKSEEVKLLDLYKKLLV